MTTKVKKVKPEEVIPATELNGNITALQVTFGNDGKHGIYIKTTGDVEDKRIFWDSMTNGQQKLCEDAWDESVIALGVEVVEVTAK